MAAGSPDDFSTAGPRRAAPDALKQRALPLSLMGEEKVPEAVSAFLKKWTLPNDSAGLVDVGIQALGLVDLNTGHTV